MSFAPLLRRLLPLILLGLLCGFSADAPQRPLRAPQAMALIALSELPPEARTTLALIRQGGPFPHARDGIEFRNRERRLPLQSRGYYREYTVRTPGERTRGARRLIHGSADEFYYTADHYASFQRVKP